jgi:membrane protease YdiL (CAAX protease family)
VAKVLLSGREKRALILWVLAGIVGLWYAHAHFFEAFPEASVNFKVTRGEALARAKSFVEALGPNVDDYRSVIVFGVNDNAKTYLEREVGLKEANRMMSSEVNVWNWDVRFFRPKQEEEFRVGVSPQGNITGYQHKVPEAKAGGQPSREAAEKTAQEFLVGKLGKPANDWDFLSEEANSEKKPNRADWSFTWEKHGFRAKDAPERLQISLHGDEIGGASETLKVPEQWERDYAHLRSTNVFYNQVAVIPYLILFGACLWMGIQMTRRGQTGWALALQLGAIVAVFLTAMQLNHWPIDLYQYDTNSAYGSFAILQVMGALLFGLGSALTVTLVLPGGEPLYRAAKPQFLRLRQAFTWRGLRTKEFFSSIIVGLSLAAVQMGFLVAFYLIANHFGAWAPQELNYEDSVSTVIPWIGGIAIGLLAATSEEFLFRLFAIPLLQKVTKSNVIAVILPAFAWGFLHTAYPNEPPYIRGLEVGLIGIGVGIVFLRWGILATLVWHYTVDASLVGLLLIRSSSLYFRISGLVVGLAVLIPFGIAVYSRVLRGTFEDDADLLNGAVDPVRTGGAGETVPAAEISASDVSAAEPVAATARGYSALSTGMIGLLCVCMVLGGVATWKLKPVRVGGYLKLKIDAKEAAARSEEILKQRGVDSRNYKTATIFVNVTDATASEYLREKIGVPALNEIYEKRIPGALWHVRFFRDGQPEEYSVVLLPDGTLHSVHHDIAEAAAGASLKKEDAVAKAQEFLRTSKHIDLSRWTLVEATSEKKPHRLDHRLIWQENQPLDETQTTTAADPASHAFGRMQVSVVGDEVTSYRTFIKIPDEWRRQREEQSVARTIFTFLPVLLMLGFAGTVLVFFLREIKSDLMREVPWRRFSLWGLYGIVAYILIFAFADHIAQALSQYSTAMPLKFVFGALGIGLLVGMFFFLGAIVLLFAMAWFFLRQAFAETDFPGWRGMAKNYYRDALLIGVGGTAALIALKRVSDWMSAHWPTPHPSLGAAFGNDFDSVLPGISISATAMLHGLLFTGAIAATAAFVAAHCKSPVVRGLLFVMASLAMVGAWGSTADFLKQWIAGLVFLAVVVFAVARVVRLNLLGYFLALAIPTLLAGCVELLAQPNGFYHTQGLVCAAVLGAVLAWLIAAWLTTKDAPEDSLAALRQGQ